MRRPLSSLATMVTTIAQNFEPIIPKPIPPFPDPSAPSPAKLLRRKARKAQDKARRITKQRR